MTAGWLAGWLAQSVIIVPLRGSILQAETCQILNLAENPRWSPSAAIHPTWPFVYWIYFCILHNQNGMKGFWEHKGVPALVLQWTLSWPYNKPDMVHFLLLAIWPPFSLKSFYAHLMKVNVSSMVLSLTTSQIVYHWASEISIEIKHGIYPKPQKPTVWIEYSW